MQRIFQVKPSDPKKDPSHPDSHLPLRSEADVWLRLVRKFGFGRGMKLFGVWMSIAHEHGDVQAMLDYRERSDMTKAFKDCGLAPDYIKPRELNDWTRRWFEAGFDVGMLSTGQTMTQKEALN